MRNFEIIPIVKTYLLDSSSFMKAYTITVLTVTILVNTFLLMSNIKIVSSRNLAITYTLESIGTSYYINL